MMYEMLSGHLPFDADDVVEVAIKQITDKPKSLQELAPNVPHGLVEITERAMAKRPENRYASAAEMLGALNAYVEDPSIVFNYTYLPDEIPEKVVEHPVKTKKEAPEPKKTRKSKKKKPVLPAGAVRHHRCVRAGLHGAVLDHPQRFQHPDERKGRHRAGRLQRHDSG